MDSGKKAQALAGVVGNTAYYARVALQKRMENHPYSMSGNVYQNKDGDMWTGKNYTPDTSVVYDGSRLQNLNEVSHEDASVHEQELAQMARFGIAFVGG